MIRYKIYQNQQQKGLNAGKWFARAVSDETFDLAKLAEHMSKHNSPYSGGVIKGGLHQGTAARRQMCENRRPCHLWCGHPQ